MKPTLQHIIATSARLFGVAESEILECHGPRPACRARMVAIYVANEAEGASRAASVPIGKAFHKDHASIWAALRRAGVLMKSDKAFASDVERLRTAVGMEPT